MLGTQKRIQEVQECDISQADESSDPNASDSTVCDLKPSPKESSGWAQSRKIGVYVWLLPPLMLRVSIYLFLAGVLALLWVGDRTSKSQPRKVE